MVSDRLKKIINTFRTQGVMNFLEPASEEQISQFEKKTGSDCLSSTGSGSASAMAASFSCRPACSSTVSRTGR